MSSRYRHIVPNSHQPGVQVADVPTDPSVDGQQQKKKRNPIRVACNACRQRKTQCDGKRERCGSCIKRGCQCNYVSDNADDTPAGALKKLNKRLEENIKATEGFFNHLRTAEQGEALEAFHHMRQAATFDELMAWFKARHGMEQSLGGCPSLVEPRLGTTSSDSSTIPDSEGPGGEVSMMSQEDLNDGEAGERKPPTPLSQWVNNVVTGEEVVPPDGYWQGGGPHGLNCEIPTNHSCIDPSLLYQ